MLEESLERVAHWLREAQNVLFVTGAGISADSGLPTYRGVGGLYQQTDPAQGLPIESILSGPMFAQRPELTWEYLGQIEQACRGACPNRAHRLIAWLEQRLPRVCVLTQNVDGLHDLAGSRSVIDIHGDIHDLRCTVCDDRTRVDDYSQLTLPPVCSRCGGLIRPDVVLFEEMLPEAKLAQLRAQLIEGFDLVFSIGTSSLFPYITGPVLSAQAQGVPTVEINPGETDLSATVAVRLPLGAAEACEQLETRLRRFWHDA